MTTTESRERFARTQADLPLDLGSPEGKAIAAMRLFRMSAADSRGGAMFGSVDPASRNARDAWSLLRSAVFETFNAYVCPVAPTRPAKLPDDDDDLRGLMRSISRKSKRSKDEKETAALFGTWRASVFQVEEEAVGRIQTVALVWLACIDADDREGAKLCRAFLEHEYDMAPDVSRPRERVEVPRWSSRLARAKFRRVLPARLANYQDDD